MPCKSPEKQMEKVKERYRRLKEHHICVSCGKRQAIQNRVHCSECAEKAKKRSKEDYDWLKQHHICVNCGQNPAERNRVHCYECNMKFSEKSRKYRESRTDDQKEAVNEYIRN